MTQDEWRGRVDSRLNNIEQKLIHLEISNATGESTSASLDKRLSSIEDTLKWLVRLIIGALILALLGIAFGI